MVVYDLYVQSPCIVTVFALYSSIYYSAIYNRHIEPRSIAKCDRIRPFTTIYRLRKSRPDQRSQRILRSYDMVLI